MLLSMPLGAQCEIQLASLLKEPELTLEKLICSFLNLSIT